MLSEFDLFGVIFAFGSPNAHSCVVGSGKQNSLCRMPGHSINFLRMPGHGRRGLLLLAVEHLDHLVNPTGCHNILLHRVNVDTRDAGFRGAVRGVRARLLEALDLFLRRESGGLDALLACSLELFCLGTHGLQHILGHRLAVRGRGGSSCGTLADTLLQILVRSHSLITLRNQASDAPAGGIMLVECLGQLLAKSLQVFLQSVRFQHCGVPFLLKEGQNAWDAGGCKITRCDGAVCLDSDQVIHGQVFARDGAFVTRCQVLLDQALLEHMASLARHHRFLWNLAGK
mmetsp:Transcript_49088/g.72925  ORF Transcript_49088/g.72925 Transcript_49088/m.72925 type:complete len:286 (+) Transcript_49088:752-1609(+)